MVKVVYNDVLNKNLEELGKRRELKLQTLQDVGALIFKTRGELKQFLKDNPQFKEYLGWLHQDMNKGKYTFNMLGKNIMPSYLSDGTIFFYILYFPNKEMKYRNVYLGETVDDVEGKKTKMYGLDLLDYAQDKVYVVEGVFDRVRMVEEGYNTVSILGTSITPYQLKVLKRFKEVNLCFDSDKAGGIGMESAKKLLIKEGYTGRIRERTPNFGSGDRTVKDVDDLFRKGYTEIKFE